MNKYNIIYKQIENYHNKVNDIKLYSKLLSNFDKDEVSSKADTENEDLKSVRSITSSMNEAKYASLKKGYNPIYNPNFMPMFKTMSPEKINLQDETQNLPVYIDEDDYERSRPNAHENYKEKFRKIVNNCDIKLEVDNLMQIKNIKFDNIECDEEAQIQYYKD